MGCPLILIPLVATKDSLDFLASLLLLSFSSLEAATPCEPQWTQTILS